MEVWPHTASPLYPQDILELRQSPNSLTSLGLRRCQYTEGVKKLAKVVHQRCKKQAVWASLHFCTPTTWFTFTSPIPYGLACIVSEMHLMHLIHLIHRRCKGVSGVKVYQVYKVQPKWCEVMRCITRTTVGASRLSSLGLRSTCSFSHRLEASPIIKCYANVFAPTVHVPFGLHLIHLRSPPV